MTPNILIVFAHTSEAAATLNRLQAEPLERAHIRSEGEIPCLYRFNQGLIAISGMGLHAAQMCVAHYGLRCDEVWNLGFAGALTDQYSFGTCVSIKAVDKYIPFSPETLDLRSQEFIAFTHPSLPFEEGRTPSGCLVSSDFPIHNIGHKEHLAERWDLVDMEGYGIAYASHYLGKKCKMWKIVSDFASPAGRELIHKHRLQLSEQIADHLSNVT